MAERHRSTDGRAETTKLPGRDMPDAPRDSGRSGGDLARKIGTVDEVRHLTNRSPAQPLARDLGCQRPR